MAIERKLFEVRLTFPNGPAGDPLVEVWALVTDTDEGTSTGHSRKIANAGVVGKAVELRDAVMAFAANAGKPVTL